MRNRYVTLLACVSGWCFSGLLREALVKRHRSKKTSKGVCGSLATKSRIGTRELAGSYGNSTIAEREILLNLQLREPENGPGAVELA